MMQFRDFDEIELIDDHCFFDDIVKFSGLKMEDGHVYHEKYKGRELVYCSEVTLSL